MTLGRDYLWTKGIWDDQRRKGVHWALKEEWDHNKGTGEEVFQTGIVWCKKLWANRQDMEGAQVPIGEWVAREAVVYI